MDIYKYFRNIILSAMHPSGGRECAPRSRALRAAPFPSKRFYAGATVARKCIQEAISTGACRSLQPWKLAALPELVF
jgi:hypothetical protein